MQSKIFLTVEDKDFQAVGSPQITVVGPFPHMDSHTGNQRNEKEWEYPKLPAGLFTIEVSAKGFITEKVETEVRSGNQRVLIVLGKVGQPFYRMGKSKIYFDKAEGMFLVVLNDEKPREKVGKIVARFGMQTVSAFKQIVNDTPGTGGIEKKTAFVSIQLEVGKSAKESATAIDNILSELRKDVKGVRAGMAIIRDGKIVGAITNDLIVKFPSQCSKAIVTTAASAVGMTVTREIKSVPDMYMFTRPGGPSYDILDQAEELLLKHGAVLAEPEILAEVELDAYIPNDPLYNLQTHIPLIQADGAWELLGEYDPELRGGSPSICIAVFDPEGVAPDHPELTANLTDGTSKLLQSFDFLNWQNQTVGNLEGDHGTQCAGTATAAFDNDRGVAGIAPNCRLIGAQLPSALTGADLADAFLWAAGIDNGNVNPNFPALPTQPADIISNSWGHNRMALPPVLQAAFDRLTDEGREGKGCVVTFSVGNLGFVQFSNVRTYAAYDRTIAVGASINTNPTNPVDSSQADPNGNTNNIATTVDIRALYNPFGPEMDIVAPSHTAYALVGGALIDPTTSTTRVGAGVLDGCPGAAVCNDFATSFGGTSHSSPTIAGVSALILSANPLLTWEDVRSILRSTAIKIDFNQANATGQWVDNDGDGANEFSQWYGYGRVNVLEAVREALNLYVAQRISADEVTFLH